MSRSNSKRVLPAHVQAKERAEQREIGMVGRVFGKGEHARANHVGYSLLVSTAIVFVCLALLWWFSYLDTKTEGAPRWATMIDRLMLVLCLTVGYLFGQRPSPPQPPSSTPDP